MIKQCNYVHIDARQRLVQAMDKLRTRGSTLELEPPAFGFFTIAIIRLLFKVETFYGYEANAINS